jgi:hypothetical protein
VPSIVYGLWGAFALSPWLRSTVEPLLAETLGFLPFFSGPQQGFGLLAGGIVLSIMILPTIASVSREVLRAVPSSLREGALALGATPTEVVWLSVLPFARSGLVGATLLGLGRALGDDRQALEQFRSAYIRGSNLLQDDPFDRLDVLEGLIEGTRRTGDRAGARVYVRELVQVARAAFGGRDAKFGAALESLLSLAAGAPVPGEQALAALHEVLVCLSDGIVRGDESGALARILIEAAVQLQEQRSPLADDFLAVLERRVIDFFAARDVRRLTYLWSLQHVRVLPPGEPLQSPAETERAARALVRAADAQLAFGHWLRSDARRLLARARIDRVRIAAEAGTIDREAYTEARELLAQALREAQRTPRAHRIPLVAEELGLLAAVRPDGMEPDPELQALLDEAHATPTPVPSAEPAEPSEPTRSPAPER